MQSMAFEKQLPGTPGGSRISAFPMANHRARIRVLADLTKLRITLLSTLSAATGYVAYARGMETGLATCAAGVLLTAMGAGALNQCQDRDPDARMQRTRARPIPSGVLSLKSALALSILLIASGVVILWTKHGRESALIALGALAWYNILYTYLKRAWAFAVVPGAVIGALPPVIGWTAAGGSLAAPRIIALAFFIFMWQVPHFWLLLLRHGKDYELAGLPSVTGVFGARQLMRVIAVWMLATVASSLLLPLFLLANSRWAVLGLAVAGLWLLSETFRLLRRPPECLQRVFRAINIYALLVMALITADALFGTSLVNGHLP
jgi:heme o synthase